MKTHHVSLCLLSLSILLISGCGSVPTTEYYDISCSPEGQIPPENRIHSSVTIRPFGAVEAYSQSEIAYRSSIYRLHYDHYRKWSASPGALVSSELAQYLEESRLFDSVVHSSFPVRTRYQIFGRVIDFYELNQEGERYAVLSLEVTLTNFEGEPIFSLTMREMVKATKSEDLTGLAKAMSQALHNAFSKFVNEASRRMTSGEEISTES